LHVFAGVVSSYVHMPVAPGAGRIAAVVSLQAGGQLEQVGLKDIRHTTAELL
jgi:hypothetical protein